MKSVRHTARALKLRTDASARFERGLDPEIDGVAISRAVELLLEVSPGAKVTAYQDYYPLPVTPRPLAMPYNEIERLLGVSYPDDQVIEVLTRLEFEPKLVGAQGATDRQLQICVPTYRQ